MRVISARLFGDADMQTRYQEYFPAAIRAHHNLFYGWTYRVYHDGRIDQGPYYRALLALHDRGLVELCFVTRDVMIEKGMLWSLRPLWDHGVEYFCIRDVDMVASWRERRAEEEWLRSGLAFHAISDLIKHHDFPTLNGTLGFHVPQARKLLDAGPGYTADTFEKFLARAPWTKEQWSSNYRASGPGGADPSHRVSPYTTNNQFFLQTYVWPLVKHEAMEHRLSGTNTYPGVAKSRQTVGRFDQESLGVLDAVRKRSDTLVPFIGSSKENSNINLDAIVDFYRTYGDPKIEKIISECERA